MTLHPITIVDQVIEEYRTYLMTEFRARDTRLRASLEEALQRPLFLAQEPFFQAYRPFKAGKPWQALGLDAALARVMEKRSESRTAYLHQSESITHLLAADATPLVVTTGTGSGKTECFLLPVIQNAIEDTSRFKRNGLTAILIYPMNALANDQEARIKEYLQASGHTHVKVARYDRSTGQSEREALRKNPPHILLTNYMLLEYLLVRPADRDALFVNHRCRFVVLDEVHTYRGSLGANIALLFRRLKAHLEDARQDWDVNDQTDPYRFPTLLSVATSATIKSVDETGRTPEEVQHLREVAVQAFLGTLTGFAPDTFTVIGEALQELDMPPQARWPATPALVDPPAWDDAAAIHHAVAQLAGLPDDAPLTEATQAAGILWTLNDLLARRPLSMSQIVEEIRAAVPERADADLEQIRQEVHTAMVAGAALPDGTPGALRLRTHRFIRGGWHFHRCVDPRCGMLYAMGEERCTCGHTTAPLYLCRSCGADTLRLRGKDEPEKAALTINADADRESEWWLYDRDRLDLVDDEDGEYESAGRARRQMKRRPVLYGSFDPATGSFDLVDDTYPMRVALAPARNTCLVCGATAGSGSILTPVALGTSAAVRALSEGLVEGLAAQHAQAPEHDGKERLLIFADSRQDAAHQARFITYAGRYDRMRRRLVRLLEDHDGTLLLGEAVKALMARGVERHDNPQAGRHDDPDFLPPAAQARAMAWEEAPLLDDLAISAGYRATVCNLGLVGVRYATLDRYIAQRGEGVANTLGISTAQLLHLARCLLDEMRVRHALSCPLLCYHPANPSCPEEFRQAADWERRVKSPNGYACNADSEPVAYLDAHKVAEGIRLSNVWRKPKTGGRGPGLERKFKHLLTRMGGIDPIEDNLLELLGFLLRPGLLTVSKLHGFRQTADLLQVNADSIVLELVHPEDRYRCTVCNVKMPWAIDGAPCPACHGTLEPWPAEEVDADRYVQRIRKDDLLPLVAGEHTAQVTVAARIALEEDFKGSPQRSPMNVLACSPTLEMGIDVGSLDAVVMRNVPPRPDNYAQRGGRAGRRSRVGIVLGYARSTPHDVYFYDKPREMIAGEVPAPVIGLGNRDVVQRHLNAIAFGTAEPGLAGRMEEYITFQGELVPETIEELLAGVEAQFGYAARLALRAWGDDILIPVGLDNYEKLMAALGKQSARMRDVFDRVRRQIIQLQETIDRWYELGKGDRPAIHAAELKRRLLGIRGDNTPGGDEADDRSAGHPMRRFAEFGLLPGYEFPSEPATLRLLRDQHEEEPIAVERRFGLAQYQPDAPAHARGHKWRVVGLDMASPWNPKAETPGWAYVICPACDLRYSVQERVDCPRCGSSEAGHPLPGYEFGGFLARRDDTPVLEEEDRFAMASLLRCFPQWNGEIVARFTLGTGWRARLARNEDVRWVNESKPPTDAEKKRGVPYLHIRGRGFYLCPSCGHILNVPDEDKDGKKGRRRVRRSAERDPYGHAVGCTRLGQAPQPLAITTSTLVTTFRLIVDLPWDMLNDAYQRWGQSLGYALRTGMRHVYMLDGPEIEFELEPMWDVVDDAGRRKAGSLTFIDGAVGGSGFLERAARELHFVAARAIEHLDHSDCDSACYRCLKSYQNQRVHSHLSWPHIMPDLEALAVLAPEVLPLERGDHHDPKPWLAAYDAGVGSPLELAFLRLFEQHGLEVDTQVPVAPDAGERPISSADFVLKGTHVAIYIDGAAFHRGERLRRDRYIRSRLQQGSVGWQVVELRAYDLSAGADLVRRLRNMSTS